MLELVLLIIKVAAKFKEAQILNEA